MPVLFCLLVEHKLAFTADCPDSWVMYNSSCYKGFSSQDRILSYTEAQDSCRLAQSGSQLPSVHSLAEVDFIVDLGKKHGWFGPKKGVYLGGTIIEGKLIWTDGSPTDYTLWNQQATSGGCIAVFANLLFQQTSCNFGEKNLQLNWIRARNQTSSQSDQDFFICKISGVMSENVGIILVSCVAAAIIIVLSVIFILQYFTCNINLDCYRRRSPTEPYSISLSISEDALVERRK